jgi:hypothetical protein
MRYLCMATKQKCRYCDELAVAYRLETDGGKTPICAYHIPVRQDQELPELRESAAEDKNQTGI